MHKLHLILWLSSKYTDEVTPDNLGVEMKQAFRIYPKNIILSTAEAQAFARKQISK